MKGKEKSLQKFTIAESKINDLLELEQIAPKDIESLTEVEKSQFFVLITEKFKGLKGNERDEFLKKLELIISDTTKNQLWESNHVQITGAISNLMQEYGRMPSKTELATKTELSRQTIHKHLKEYRDHPIYLGQIEQFRFMASRVLAKVFAFAINGDIRAAKLYFEIIGNPGNSSSLNTVINTQNNYIQINQMKLSQETIKRLTSDQLCQIETILKTVMPN